MSVTALPDLLYDAARKYPSRDALVFKEERMSYAALSERSDALALVLLKAGVHAGDAVGIMLHKSIEMVVAVFAVLKAGAAYVPIDPQSPIERARHIVESCAIAVMVSSDVIADSLCIGLGGALRIVRLPLPAVGDDSFRESTGRVGVAPGETAPAYILHTSGSTGVPKGVVITHANCLSFILMAADFFRVTSRDRLCSVAPLHFDLSVFDIFVSVRAGAALVLVPEAFLPFPAKLAEYVAQQKVSVWNSVSSLLVSLAVRSAMEKHGFDSMRVVHFSGDIMPAKYLRILMRHMPSAAFYNIYGQTEANSSMCYPIAEIKGDERWVIPIGRPFPGFEIFLMDDGRVLDPVPGAQGELIVRSGTVALGYLKNIEETNQKFISDPRGASGSGRCYRTGDIVRVDDEGNLVFLGRRDSMIKSRGYRIELGEIEAVLNRHPLVGQAVATPIPDELIGNRIVADVLPAEGALLDARELHDFCCHHLSRKMVPEAFRFHKSLPRTPTGKIDRRALANQEWAGDESRGNGTM